MAFPGGNIIRVTPTVFVGTTDDGDVMFNAKEIPNAVSSRGGVSKLHAIYVIDKDNEAHNMDLVFLETATNLGTVDAAVSITDSDLAENLIASFNYDQSDSSIAFVNSTVSSFTEFDAAGPAGILPLLLQAAGGSTSVYFSAIAREATDFAATNDLTFIFHIEYLW